MNKELKVIDFYCKKCKKSMKVSYMVTGNRNYPVLPRVMMKCHHCGRVMTLKNFKEGELLDRVEQDKYYILIHTVRHQMLRQIFDRNRTRQLN